MPDRLIHRLQRSPARPQRAKWQLGHRMHRGSPHNNGASGMCFLQKWMVLSPFVFTASHASLRRTAVNTVSQPLVASLRPRRTPQCDGNVHERVCLYTTDTIVSVASKYILFELWMVDGSALSRCAPTLKAHTCPRPTPMPHAAHDDA